ncbi:ribosomal RNA small subunit methyltransferase I-like [Globicephala melas]|uniref:ribosomal RNA small subunit methyltransferase I-like n=1 Tax=Globicephala melas TaxID=9731 RepID=UPI00293D95E5|nr:ribosomal RNA small subunit methyltransferase I-like [Globicephala melas]
MNSKAKLYLIPVPLADIEHSQCLPEYNKAVILTLKYFIVENVRSARRFLKAVDRTIDIDSLNFVELNKHSNPKLITSYLDPMKEGHSIGIISEAGCPAVADPGSDVVAIAQRKGFEVCPLIGPSSILLALMGSGFNGQGFSFNGYLPIQDSDRSKTLKDLEAKALRGQTQIFIETPYRNDKLLQELIKQCKSSTLLCIASNLTAPDCLIQTKTLSQWAKNLPNLHKRPTIFLLGQYS